jgi:tetratricopeptide (TPR) repeat protein
MGRREAAQVLRRHGAVVVDRPDAAADLVVVGEEGIPLPESENLDDWFDEPTSEAIRAGTLEVITETQLWQRLGMVDQPHEVHRLYTPAMLAELLGVSVAVIRRWRRRGLIQPAREVRRLPYFDIQEVAAARRLAQLLGAGVSPQKIEKKLAGLARLLPGVQRPLAQLSVIVQGKEILLRQGDGLIDLGGQLRFDFEAWESGVRKETPSQEVAKETATIKTGQASRVLAFLSGESDKTSPAELREWAAEAEEFGDLEGTAEMYRAALAAGGPDAETCFQLAEILYRLGDLSGARERYYMAVELDEDYVEARANLGCVLAETGQRELAVAAFEGALRYHGAYADVHYHLARTLDELGRHDDASQHWRAFLAMAPDSPWAQEAKQRLAPE